MKKGLINLFVLISLISCSTSKKMSDDLSVKALKNIKENIMLKDVRVEILESDLGYKTAFKKQFIFNSSSAHPTYEISSIIFDKNNKILKYEDIINKDSEILYTKKIEEIIKNEKNKTKYFKDVKVNLKKSIIVLFKNEIIFLFPHYELGPYSSGIIEFKFNINK